MFGNLQQQGDTNSNHDLIDIFSCFHHTVNFLDSDFSADFTYGDVFDFDSISSGSFEYNIISCEFPVGGRRCQKKRQKNCVFWVENIKKSCWYRYFMRLGLTREITHELSNNDRYREFRHWLTMLVPSDIIACLAIQRGSIMMVTGTLDWREERTWSATMVICFGQHQFARTRKQTMLHWKVSFRQIWRVSERMLNVLLIF